MDTEHNGEVSNISGMADQSRREALKRFGRYAAAAPTAMVLLQPTHSYAGKKGRSRGRGRGRGRGGNSPY